MEDDEDLELVKIQREFFVLFVKKLRFLDRDFKVGFFKILGLFISFKLVMVRIFIRFVKDRSFISERQGLYMIFILIKFLVKLLCLKKIIFWFCSIFMFFKNRFKFDKLNRFLRVSILEEEENVKNKL